MKTTTKPRKPIRFLGTKVATVVAMGALFTAALGGIAAAGGTGVKPTPSAEVTYVTPNGSSPPSNRSAVSSQGASPSEPKQQPVAKVRKTRGS
jgi:hypothetical protein